MIFSKLFIKIRLGKLSVTIGISMAVLVFGYFLSLVFSYYNSLKIQEKLPNISELAVVSTEITQKIIITFEHQTKLYENAVMTGESEMIEKAEKKFSELGKSLNSLALLDGISENTKANILSVLEKLITYTNEASSAYLQLCNGKEVPIGQIARLADEKTRISERLTHLAIAVRKNLSENISGVIRESERRNKWNMIFSSVFVGISLMAMWMVIRNYITRRLNDISDGLTISSAKLAHASSRMASESEQLSKASLLQKDSIQNTSDSLGKILSGIKDNIASAMKVKGLREQIYSYIQVASTAMKETSEAMRKIRHRGEEIAKITNVIDEIAFQTTLLALNAAVEAARAGEFGAGFGVVAGEVRNLALKTGDSAKHIRELIESTVAEIDDGSKLVEKTGDYFQTSMEYSMKAGELIEEISEASEEQSEGIENIRVAMAEVENITEQNAANADKSASVSSELQLQAKQMSRFVHELVSLLEGASPTTSTPQFPQPR